jgi:translocation and assembly module TamB
VVAVRPASGSELDQRSQCGVGDGDALGLTGGDFLAQRIGKGIGLDQVSVGAAPAGGSEVAADPTRIAGSQAAQGAGGASAASQTAQLTLGKYLTPKLFVSYGVSLFQPGQTFRMLYELGHGFKVQSETGVASGGDLIYTIDRGH